jgi:predicted nucleotidyltransferase
MERRNIAIARAAYAELLKQSLGLIVERLSALPEVERINVFGSYARGRADLFTDLDILVVMNTEESFLDRLRRLYGLLAAPVDMDLLCYTPREFQDLKQTSLLKRILMEERVLYEKKRA